MALHTIKMIFHQSINDIALKTKCCFLKYSVFLKIQDTLIFNDPERSNQIFYKAILELSMQ
jgi:hypothetical protein